MKKDFYIIKIFFLLIIPHLTIAQNFWQQTGGPYGRGYVTAINTQSNGNIYIAIDKAGLYWSIDHGKSFSYVNRFFSNTSIRSIIVNSLDHIFVGILDNPRVGLFRSTDVGYTWIQELSSEYVRCMTIDLESNIYAGTNESGIFRSSDNGDNWTQIDVESTIKTVKTIEVNQDGWIFSSGWTDTWSETRAICSSNNGITWDSLVIPADIYITNFAFSQNGNIVASFSPHTSADSSGFLLSSDNGTTWIRKNYIKSYYGVHSVIFDEYSNSFYAVVYNITNWEIIKSTDHGNTWLYLSSIDYNQPDIFCFNSNPQGYLYAGSIDGLKYSSDFGYNWVQSDSGIYASGLTNLTLLPNDRLFVGSAKGNFRLADDKISWQKDSALVGSFLIANTGDYFLSNAKVYRSTNSGNSWVTVFQPSLSFSATSEIAQTSNDYIFTGGWEYGGVHGTGSSKVWRTTNNGETWNTVYSNGSDKLIYTVTTTNDDIIIAGGNDGEIVRSTDYGETWNQSNYGLPLDASCLVIRSNSNGVLFAGTYDYGIFRSTDGGLNWNVINNGLSSLKINSIWTNSPGKIFIGTDEGVFVSTNNGDVWTSLNSGLVDVSVHSLLCDSLGYLYAATNSTGVYRSVNSTTSVNQNPSNFPKNYKLSQNYPNPFNPITKINYQIPNTGFVILKVYDLLGKEMATLVNEEKPAGSYEVEFDGGKLSSGIYFYKLQAGDYTEVKKMILLK